MTNERSKPVPLYRALYSQVLVGIVRRLRDVANERGRSCPQLINDY